MRFVTVSMDSASKEQPVLADLSSNEPTRETTSKIKRHLQTPLLRGSFFSRLLALVLWAGLGTLFYTAVQIPAERGTAFGTSLLLVLFEAAGCSLLARYVLGAATWTYRIPACGFFFAMGLLAELRIIVLIQDGLINMPQLLALWSVVGCSLLMLGWTLDPTGRPRSTVARAGMRSDLLIAGTLLFVSLTLRLAGPVTAAVDEATIFGEMLSLGRHPHTKFWDTSTTANPYFIHWLVYIVTEQVKPLADSFVLEKFTTAFFASLSIPLWYWAITMLCGRRIALTAAALLAFFGWHWVNSRFLYVYPYELAAIPFATGCGILAFGRGRLLAAVALGLTLTFCVFAKKISIMIFPLTAFLFLDFLIFRPTVKRKIVARGLIVVAAVFFVSYLPIIVADRWSGAPHDRYFRFNQALEARSTRLAQFDLTPTQAYFHVFKDAVYQLFVKSSDAFRHYFRPRGPLLDPIVAWLGVLGFSLSVALSYRRRECRLALVGLVLFTLPMVLSFPLDSLDNQGISRRMIGASLFLVLVAAIGADFIARILGRLIPLWIIPTLLCIISATVNIHDYFTKYLNQPMIEWLSDHGLRRAAVLLAARDAARHGTTVFVLDNPLYHPLEGLIDVVNVSFLPSEAELRKAITSSKPGRIMVIIPGNGPAYGYPIAAFAREFADILPEHLWLPGRLAPNGFPLIMTVTIDRPA